MSQRIMRQTGIFVGGGRSHGKQTVPNVELLADLFDPPAAGVTLRVHPVLTALSLPCVIDRCAGGERDVEEENIRRNAVRLHQT